MESKTGSGQILIEAVIFTSVILMSILMVFRMHLGDQFGGTKNRKQSSRYDIQTTQELKQFRFPSESKDDQ